MSSSGFKKCCQTHLINIMYLIAVRICLLKRTLKILYDTTLVHLKRPKKEYCRKEVKYLFFFLILSKHTFHFLITYIFLIFCSLENIGFAKNPKIIKWTDFWQSFANFVNYLSQFNYILLHHKNVRVPSCRNPILK